MAESFFIFTFNILQKRKMKFGAEITNLFGEETLRKVMGIAHLGGWAWNIKDYSEKWSDEQFRILSVLDEQTAVDECILAGATGFVLKRTATNNLTPAVRGK
jgi:hypothetical protein